MASTDETQLVREYVRNTHGATHRGYSIAVQHVLCAARDSEADAFRSELGNRQLLWHGSRLTNWAGILASGLKIAPAEAPVTGYMFGKGIYFADMASKSANYCGATTASPTAVLLLCEVALGEHYERITAEPGAARSAQSAGKHSTWGVGHTMPDPKGARQLDGVHVPMGKAAESGYLKSNLERLKQAEGTDQATLLYNEYVVYDVRQVKAKYVVVVKLDFVS